MPEDSLKSGLLQKIAEGKFLPSFSDLALELIHLAADEKSSARDLAAVIERDPGLATRLLKLAGTAFFARQAPVTSIPQAVVLLGFNRVRIMALSLSLTDTFPVGKTGVLDYKHFWKTSLYRALVAQDFGRHAKADPGAPEEAFAAALILDIGKAMLYEAVASGQDAGPFPVEHPPLEETLSWEKARWGLHHREVGRFVLQRWHFPEPFLECQSFFGDEALKEERSPLCRIVELARKATDFVFCLHPGLDSPQNAVQDHLGLDPETLNGLLAGTFRKVEELALHLRMDFPAHTEILGAMEKANQALARISSAMEDSLDHALPQAEILQEPPFPRRGAEGGSGQVEKLLDAVAHEIRNPLTAIGGFAKRLAKVSEEDSRLRGYAKIIESESARLERTLKDMIEYSQPLAFRFTAVDANRLIDNVLAGAESEGCEKQILLEKNLEKGRCVITIDEHAMTKAVNSLLGHAISLIGRGPGTLRLSVQRLEEAGSVRMAVSSTGGPMTDEDRLALLHADLSSRSFGSGLGLPLARKIILAHGGRIELKQESGFANTVVVHLPLTQAPSFPSTPEG
jgi:signal transduction histidine kinase